MSFLRAVTTDKCRAEELKSAWKSLSYDILNQCQPATPLPRHTTMTPPLSPESMAYQGRHSPASFCSIGERFSQTEAANFSSDNWSSRHNGFPGDVQSHMHQNRCSCCPPPPSLAPTLLSAVTTESYRREALIAPPPHPMLSTASHTLPYFPVTSQNSQDLKDSIKRKHVDEPELARSEGKKKRKTNEEQVACQVHGILSLPGCREPRYNITADELQRRVDQPECLTKVDMISYVRLAKNSARSLLDKHGVKTNQHNQRSEHTILSKMSEAETQVLAKGIREMNYRYFPGSWFARKSVQEISKNNTNTRQHNEALLDRLKEDEITKCVLLDIYFGLEKRKADKEMNIFNLMSHTFGVPNLQNHILFLLSYIEEESRILKKSVNT